MLLNTSHCHTDLMEISQFVLTLQNPRLLSPTVTHIPTWSWLPNRKKHPIRHS